MMKLDVLPDGQAWAEALLEGERRLLEMVTSGCALPAVLGALCSLVESSTEVCLCSVLLTDANGTRLQHGAAPSLPPSFNETIDGLQSAYEERNCSLLWRKGW